LSALASVNADLSALSDAVTGRFTTRSGRGRDPAPRSERGRDIDTVSLCTRSGRYKSRRRNKMGGEADPDTVNRLSINQQQQHNCWPEARHSKQLSAETVRMQKLYNRLETT